MAGADFDVELLKCMLHRRVTRRRHGRCIDKAHTYGGAEKGCQLSQHQHLVLQNVWVVPVITLGAMRRLCTLDARRIDITFAGALAGCADGCAASRST
jgi:hypothetical protein